MYCMKSRDPGGQGQDEETKVPSALETPPVQKYMPLLQRSGSGRAGIKRRKHTSVKLCSSAPEVKPL